MVAIKVWPSKEISPTSFISLNAPVYLLACAQGPVAIAMSPSANDLTALSHFSTWFSLYKAHHVIDRHKVLPFLVCVQFLHGSLGDEKAHIRFSGTKKLQKEKDSVCVNEHIAVGKIYMCTKAIYTVCAQVTRVPPAISINSLFSCSLACVGSLFSSKIGSCQDSTNWLTI